MTISIPPLHYEDYSSNRIRRIASNLEETTETLRYIDLKLKLLNLKWELCRLDPDVFVSHKSDDKRTAETVAETIKECGLEPYLDTRDSKVDGDGPELVDYINTVIGYCHSLIAVVSDNTVESWWVPLEIGIAITKNLHLGTYLILNDSYTKEDFPSYLWKWPVLKNTDDLKNWCEERKKTDKPEQFYESLKQKHPNMFRQ